MRTSRVPVLIVGAGPAGTMVALELARRGVHVRIVDALARPANTSRAIYLRASTLDLFARIDKRLAERFLERGLPSSGSVAHRVDALGKRHVGPDADDSRAALGLVHRQSETELYLREYTSAHFGVSPDWSTSCVGVRQGEGGIVATLASDGAEEQVQCRFLVACDGVDSSVRRCVGLEPARGTEPGEVRHQLDAVLDGFPADSAGVHRCEGPDYRLDVVQLPGELYRLELASDGRRVASGSAAEVFSSLLSRHFDGVKIGRVVAEGVWQSPTAGAARFRSDQVFFAGDAVCASAGSAGEGLNAALEDGFNLGWKLAFVAKTLAQSTLLATYEGERRAERSERAPVGTAARAAVGQRVPDIALERGRTLFEYLRHPLCTVLALPATAEGVRPLAAALQPFGERFANVLEVRVGAPAAELTAHFGASAVDRLVLVRPDGRSEFSCAASELAALDAHLATWAVAAAAAKGDAARGAQLAPQ